MDTVHGQIAAMRARAASSAELLTECLQRIEQINPMVNAVVALDVDRARIAAQAADAALARGEWLGPLHGVPFTVKDAIETAGIRSTGGAVELSEHVPTVDAPAVARLKAAGAVLFGKTNAPAWSADIQTHNELFGRTNNPWDLARTAGGSSGGAAAAVAAGLTAFDLGTDIGGSIRIPASHCGVFGHKPSYGVVPQRGYLNYVGGGTIDADVNVFGPLARSAADLSLLFKVLAGPNAQDAVGWRLELPAPRATELADLRVGLWLDDEQASVSPDVGAVLRSAVAELAAAGARMNDAHPRIDVRRIFELYLRLVRASSVLRYPEDQRPRLDHGEWLQLATERAAVRQVWAEWFTDYDVLICPVAPTPAFVHDLDRTPADRSVTIDGRPRSHAETTIWTGIVGVAYLPSTVIPAGRAADGLPVGLQIVGPYLEDHTTLAAAHLISDVLGPWTPPTI